MPRRVNEWPGWLMNGSEIRAMNGPAKEAPPEGGLGWLLKAGFRLRFVSRGIDAPAG
jgi:hypothetical protein